MNPLLRKAAAEATESLLERSTEIERKKQGKKAQNIKTDFLIGYVQT